MTSLLVEPVDPLADLPAEDLSEAWKGLLKWVDLASRFPLVVPADLQLPCVGTHPEVFFEQRHSLQARRVCAECPIRLHCLDVAVARDEDGVWGGMTKAERDRWVAAQRRDRRRSLSRSTRPGVESLTDHPTAV